MNKKTFTAVAILAATAVVFCICFAFFGYKEKLVIYNGESKEIYGTYDIYDGMEFSVEFVHSVNKSPVRDFFVVRGNKLYAEKTVYSAFGAGVQTEIEEGQTLTFDEDGNMVVEGFDTEFDKIKYIVGTVSDHLLTIEGKTVSMTEMCGKNAHVVFEIKRVRR
ncbi:MAG: DUF1850 domain-containing protein [Clostridia bacterium]|nr:DUF1850 domain-containing protein [Clostridia bacterium]